MRRLRYADSAPKLATDASEHFRRTCCDSKADSTVRHKKRTLANKKTFGSDLGRAVRILGLDWELCWGHCESHSRRTDAAVATGMTAFPNSISADPRKKVQFPFKSQKTAGRQVQQNRRG